MSADDDRGAVQFKRPLTPLWQFDDATLALADVLYHEPEQEASERFCDFAQRVVDRLAGFGYVIVLDQKASTNGGGIDG